ncbi:UNKNOWN [Stylonychia lemnae]|uniref:Ig-like domain-containing protein n=1 Tax=Stylonychia lemnae TaxID=5949 RepID=A0A078AGA8_STYLE|nr:UNKNOWN [Stylonychia lemnae]|eukprot:CDW80866.1 UNKNOWN [Stylonychia lemnae]
MDFNSQWLTKEPEIVPFKSKIMKIALTYSSILAIDCKISKILIWHLEEQTLWSWGQDPMRKGVLGFGEYQLNIQNPQILLQHQTDIQTTLYSCNSIQDDKNVSFVWGTNQFQTISTFDETIFEPVELKNSQEKLILFDNLICLISPDGELKLKGHFRKQHNLHRSFSEKSIVKQSVYLSNDSFRSQIQDAVDINLKIDQDIINVHYSSSMALIQTKNSQLFYLLNEKFDLYEIDIPFQYEILDIQYTYLTIWILIQGKFDQQKYLIETFQKKLQFIKVGEDFNQGIQNYSNTKNMNGQVSFIFEEVVDIEKINKEYEDLKKKINKKLGNENQNQSQNILQVHNTSQYSVDQQSDRCQLELNFDYDTKKIGDMVELDIEMKHLRNIAPMQFKWNQEDLSQVKSLSSLRGSRLALQDITAKTNNCQQLLSERDIFTNPFKGSQCSYVNYQTIEKSLTPKTPKKQVNYKDENIQVKEYMIDPKLIKITSILEKNSKKEIFQLYKEYKKFELLQKHLRYLWMNRGQFKRQKNLIISTIIKQKQHSLNLSKICLIKVQQSEGLGYTGLI